MAEDSTHNQNYLISKDIAAATSIMIRHITFIMPMTQLVKSSSLFQSSCARLNPYDLQHHCEKEIPSCIHGTSILLLGHLGASNINSPKMDT
jgi:hypothetical protein